MAMVFLTDRKMNNDTLINKNFLNNKLPPIPKKEEEKTFQNIKPPFNIQGKGHQNLNIINNNPGPGSYNIEMNILKPKQNSNSNLNFLTKSPRFNNNDSNKSPGPGAYNLIEKPLIQKRLFQRPSSNISSKYKTNSVNNISTIPAKRQLFGYLVNEDGDLIRAIDPEFEKYYSGEKNNSIGPDRYNFLLKEKNPIVNWKRMSARNLSAIKKDQNSILNININSNNISKNSMNNESIGDISKISKLDTDISFIKNNGENNNKHRIKMKDMIENYKRKLNLSRIVISKKTEIEPIDIQNELEFLNYAENSIFNKRGIFYPISLNQMKYQSKPEEYQFFGSSVERGIDKLPLTDRILNPGPGSYFHETLKKFKIKNKNKDKNKINSTFSRSKRPGLIMHKSSSTLGPGSYNIKNNLSSKKSFSNIGSFACERRFPEKEQNENCVKNQNYINEDYKSNNNWKKEFKKEFNKKYFVNVEKEIKKIKDKKIEEKKPDFNNYQNERFVNILKTKVFSKINPYVSQNSPFMSGLGRFIKNKEDENSIKRGPGAYELRKNIGKSYQNNINNAPFNSNSEKKSNYLFRANSCVSPGEYVKDSYFDWNKKSFNIMFV